MNKDLQDLVELSKFDASIDAFLPKLEALNEKLNSKADEISATNEQIDAIQADIEDIATQIKATNAHIAEFSAKIKDVSKKTSSIKTEREMKSLNLEEDLAKEQLSVANDDIVKYEKLIDTKNGIKKDLEDKKSSLEDELTALEDSVGSQKEKIEKDRATLYTKKDKLLNSMDSKIISFYEKIRKWAGNSAVVKVRKQACYGCFMKINDKTYSSVIKGDDIVTCPHCGRILYKDSE